MEATVWTHERLVENAIKNMRHALFVSHWQGVDFWRCELKRLAEEQHDCKHPQQEVER